MPPGGFGRLPFTGGFHKRGGDHCFWKEQPSHDTSTRIQVRTRRCRRKNGAEKVDIFMSYSATLVGFVGADPEQRQARNNSSKFTVLSVATQRSWKNAQDEWASKTEWHRVCVIWNQNCLSTVMARRRTIR
jgi:hypothetical protein